MASKCFYAVPEAMLIHGRPWKHRPCQLFGNKATTACGAGIGELNEAAQVCKRGDRLPVVQVGGSQNAINISRQTTHRKLQLSARGIVHARELHRLRIGNQRQIMVTARTDGGNAVKAREYVGLAA